MVDDPEVSAMATVSEILKQLPPEAAARVLRWAAERFSVAGAVVSPAKTEENRPRTQLADLPSLFPAAGPVTEMEKVLVAAYWLQEIQGTQDFDAQQVNAELKNLGHGIGNITRAFDHLIDERPQLAIQTHKSGTSKQSRKKYRITTEGTKVVEEMLRRNAGPGGSDESK